jgi:hypothetical protein
MQQTVGEHFTEKGGACADNVLAALRNYSVTLMLPS